MATVTYDNRSVMLEGRRIWLVSGSVHYFRVPAQLWRDRLLKAQRGGLNCVETYVPWNFHEFTEGKWDFSGDRDVVEFIRQAGDLGLYVIVRPGPYICAEWDFGGFPAYLRTKSGLQLRTNNAVYTHYYDKYFRQLLPRLADLQISRGGNLVAIGCENEYFMTTMPDRQEYLEFIATLIRRAGFDIPILTCNWLTEPLVPGTIECNNCFEGGLANLRRLRRLQPDAPLITTEFWPGWFDSWGSPHATRDDRQCARLAMELLGAGSQTNYYMYHGGTNFGFWGGRSVSNDRCYITTSYDYDAPIAEGGGLTRKYYLLRLVNLLGRHMADLLGAALPVEASATLTGTSTLSVAGPKGRLTVITNNGEEGVTSARVVLSSGRVVTVDLTHFGAAAVAEQVPLTGSITLDFCSLTPLGFFGEKVLALHGVPGQAGQLSINGELLNVAVPKDGPPLTMEHQGVTIVVMPSELAERCWPVENGLHIGPDFIGETVEEVVPPAGMRQYTVVGFDGQVSVRKLRPSSRPRPKAPILGRWSLAEECAEPSGGELQWRAIDRPRDLAGLGAEQGYGWYETTLHSQRAMGRELFLPQSDDRVTVWVNGLAAGTFARGDDGLRAGLKVQLPRGDSRLVALADNLGSFNYGFYLGESKGLWGDVYDSAPMRPKAWASRQPRPDDFNRRLVPRNQACLLPELESSPLTVCETRFRLDKPVPVHFQYAGLRRHAALICNGRPGGFFAAHNGGFADVVLNNEVQEGENQLKLLVWGEMEPKWLGSIRLHKLTENLTGSSKWRFRPWSLPAASADPARDAAHLGTPAARKARIAPAWFACTFRGPPPESPPLFLSIEGARKGQVYLNGHNVGRFWTAGPQEWYYLPACWLEKVSTLLIFDEHGQKPIGSKLAFRPLGPYRKE